ncbi:MAG: histidine phosphatase family protein [Dehalococcoidia bacterium]
MTSPAPTLIYLVRHGQSVANVEPIIGGMRGDAGLTKLGREQARRLGERLRSEAIKVDALYASTLPRAMQTAEYLAAALGLPINPDDELQELRPGESDGMSWEAFLAKYGRPDFSNPHRPMSPGGESWAELLLRVGRAMHRLRDAHTGQTVLAVTHGGFVDGCFYQFMGVGHTYGVGFRTANTSITRWAYEFPDEDEPAERPARWVLLSYNDIAHVVDLATVAEPAVPLPTEESKARS